MAGGVVEDGVRRSVVAGHARCHDLQPCAQAANAPFQVIVGPLRFHLLKFHRLLERLSEPRDLPARGSIIEVSHGREDLQQGVLGMRPDTERQRRLYRPLGQG